MGSRTKLTIRKSLAVVSIILYIIGMIFLIEFILAIYSGTTIMNKKIGLKENMEINSFNISEGRKHRIDLKMKIRCPNYHIRNSEKITEIDSSYHYPYSLILYDNEKKFVTKEVGVLSSDSENSISDRYFSFSSYVSLNEFVERHFTAPLYVFNTTEANIFHIDISLNPDKRYDSELISCELIIKQNIKEISIIRVILGITLLIGGMIAIILSLKKS